MKKLGEWNNMPRIKIYDQFIDFPDNLTEDQLQKRVSIAANQIKNENSEPISNIPLNAIKDVRNIVSNTARAIPPLAMMAGEKLFNAARPIARGLVNPAAQVGNVMTAAQPDNLARTFSSVKNMMPVPWGQDPRNHPLSPVAEAIYEQYKKIGMNPWETFKKEPVSTSLALLPAADIMNTVPAMTGGILSKVPGLRLLSKIPQKAASYAAHVPEEQVVTKFTQPFGVMKSPGMEGLTESVIPKITKNLTKIINEKFKQSMGVLSKSKYLEEGAIPKENLIAVVDRTRRELGGDFGPASKPAVRTLKEIKKYVGKLNNTISEVGVRKMIRKLDKSIIYDSIPTAETSLVQDSLYGVRKGFDEILKKNKSYESISKELSDAIETRKEFIKKFGASYERGVGYGAEDVTMNRLARATKKGTIESKNILNKIKEITGEDALHNIELAKAKDAFETGLGFKETFLRPVVNEALGAGGVIRRAMKKPLEIMSEKTPSAAFVTPYINPLLKTLNNEKAKEYLKKAKGDKVKAREMAIKDGYAIPDYVE